MTGIQKLLIIIAVLTVAGCNKANKEADESPAGTHDDEVQLLYEDLPTFEDVIRNQIQTIEEKAEDFIGAGYNDSGNVLLFESLDDMNKRWGKPIQFKTVDVDNRYEIGLVDSYYEVEYDEIEFNIYHYKGENEKFIFLKVTVLKDSFPVEMGLGVGSHVSDIFDKLGRPSGADGENLMYINFDNYNSVTFFIEDQSVKKIEWNQEIM